MYFSAELRASKRGAHDREQEQALDEWMPEMIMLVRARWTAQYHVETSKETCGRRSIIVVLVGVSP